MVFCDHAGEGLGDSSVELLGSELSPGGLRCKNKGQLARAGSARAQAGNAAGTEAGMAGPESVRREVWGAKPWTPCSGPLSRTNPTRPVRHPRATWTSTPVCLVPGHEDPQWQLTLRGGPQLQA